MLKEEQKEKEIERRKGPGNLSIPSPKDNETLNSLFGTNHRLYITSQFGIYQVLTSDDIDPEVTSENVPWVVNRYINFGTSEKLFGILLGTVRNVTNSVIVDQEIQKELRTRLLPCLVSANEICYAKSIYSLEIENHRKIIEESNLQDLKSGNGLKIPSVESFEVSFGIFFSGIKRYLNSLFSVFEWACGLPEGKGSKLDKLLNRISDKKKLQEQFGDLEFLRRHEEFVLSVNRLRDFYEHPTASNYVELRNVSFVPPNLLAEPSFVLF